MEKPKKVDPEAALRALSNLIDAEEDESTKAELKAVMAKPLPDAKPSRPSYEEEATKHSKLFHTTLSPPRSITESARRIDFPGPEEVEDLLLSEKPLTQDTTKVVLLGLFKTMELHQRYVDDTFQNITAAIESLNRKAEFLTIPGLSQTAPIKETKPSLFELPKGDITKYILNPPITKRAVRVRLIEIVSSVGGDWVDETTVRSIPNDQLASLLVHWNEEEIRRILTKK